MRKWGISLQSRYRSMAKPNLAETKDLEEAIEIAEKVIHSASNLHTDDVAWLCQLIELSTNRHYGLQDPLVVSKAIGFAEKAIGITDKNDSYELYCWELLATLRLRQLEQSQQADMLKLLDQAIQDWEKVFEMMPANYQHFYEHTSTLRSLHNDRFQMHPDIKTIDTVIKLTRTLISTNAAGRADGSCFMHRLSEELKIQYILSKDIAKLNEAVVAMESCIGATWLTPHAVVHYIAYGQILQFRFSETGSLEDINKSIEIAEHVIHVTPDGDVERWARLHQLGERFGDRFVHTGQIADLDRAIEEIIASIDSAPLDHEDRSDPLNCLAIWLGRRFSLQGSAKDLQVAIEKAELAVQITEPRHSRYGMNCNTLANLLGEKYNRTREPDILDRAIQTAEDAINECEQDDEDLSCRQHGLSEHLQWRYELKRRPEDLRRAIENAKASVENAPVDHLHLPVHLDGYAKLLDLKFEEDSNWYHVNEAIRLSRQAVERIPRDHFHGAEILSTLGSLLKKRFEKFNDSKDYGESLECFQKGWNCSNASPSVRIEAASNAANILAAKFKWEECNLLLTQAVELLPRISPRSLDHVDKQYALGKFSGLASRAAASVLKNNGSPYDALKLLELGRNMIAGQILELRTDILDLETIDEPLAKRFVALRDELSATIATSMDQSHAAPFEWEARNKRRQQADQEFNEVLRRIRAYEGFENFLLPPPIKDIQKAASYGSIVVVNAGSYRCDAFIVHHDRIDTVNLGRLRMEDVELKVQQLNYGPLRSVLEWTWDAIAYPILTKLGLSEPVADDNWSRLWWILTGPLTHLPIHASGRHDKGRSETVLDRVMSSYATSIKSILLDRKHELQHVLGSEMGNAVLVSMPQTDRMDHLPGAIDEIKEVRLSCPALNLNPIAPTMPCKENVLQELRSCETFHFAGHGISDPSEPSRSTLCLQDCETNPLTVSHLRELKLQTNAPWLGYLSACSTSQVQAKNLVDETIHLASACQLAGFRHVIGTLWKVSDRYCVQVAKSFYLHLGTGEITDFAIAKALHLAVLEIRDQWKAKKSEMDYEYDSGHDSSVQQPLPDGHTVPETWSDITGHHDISHSGRAATRVFPNSYPHTFRWVPYVHFGC
ncbi:tpr containing protein [Fusarium circinatum]|uniref:Tpr containing protein n=1 Tax=Fusarium circinatum TaxID=48490 RepID=A0A8H5SSY4_FUSCI|nr:tpr containing protein [Fusarium circinatum]